MATGRHVLNDDASRHTTTAGDSTKCQSGNKKKEFQFQLFGQAPLSQASWRNASGNTNNTGQSMNSFLAPCVMTSGSASPVVGGLHHPVATYGYPGVNVPPFFYHGTLEPYGVGRPYPEFHVGNKRYRECMDYAHLGCRHFVPYNTSDQGVLRPRVRHGNKSRNAKVSVKERTVLEIQVKQQQQQENISSSHEVSSSSGESGSVKAEETRDLDPLELLALAESLKRMLLAWWSLRLFGEEWGVCARTDTLCAEEEK